MERRYQAGNHSDLKLVEGPDDLELEAGADPHSVGIHQLLHYIGAWGLASTDSQARVNLRNWRLLQLLHKFYGRLVGEELCGLVVWFPSRCLVQVIQAEAPIGVLLDGGIMAWAYILELVWIKAQ